jgi:hypothetical protein
VIIEGEANETDVQTIRIFQLFTDHFGTNRERIVESTANSVASGAKLNDYTDDIFESDDIRKAIIVLRYVSVIVLDLL